MRLQYLTWAAVAASSLAVVVCGCSSPSASRSYSAVQALPKFTAADVPATGAEEVAVAAPRWPASPLDTNLPGGGLARHPMLLIGEGYNKMFVVNEGKVIWTYSTGNGNEYDDAWLLSNGNILFSRLNYAAEVSPEKKIVWHLDPPKGMEIHTVQPIGLDKVLLMENGTPAKMVIVNKKTGAVELSHDVPDAGTGVHSQFRRVRMTAAGTYLVPFLEVNKVVEYDKDFKEIWSYKIRSPWAAIRLQNGNTLITDENDRLTREVSPKGETVWEFKLASDLPAGILFPDSQTCARLANGNTVICSRGNNGRACQLIEVTPEKKVVWALKDWQDLGPATAVQLLDDPGTPEKPGDLQR